MTLVPFYKKVHLYPLFLDSTANIIWVFVFLYLTSLSMPTSRSIYVAANGIILLFSKAELNLFENV